MKRQVKWKEINERLENKAGMEKEKENEKEDKMASKIDRRKKKPRE